LIKKEKADLEILTKKSILSTLS